MSTDPLLLLDAAFASYPEDAVPRGYEYTSKKIHNKYGLYAEIYKRIGSKDYIISFRGTEPGSLADIATNANLGWLQFDNSRDEIRTMLRDLLAEGGSVDVTGHSLGGALAQFAVYDLVKHAKDKDKTTKQLNLTTWNALGGEWALQRHEQYDASIAARINARHYYRGDDLVARLGMGHVGGVSLRLSDPEGKIEGVLAAHMKEELKLSLQAGKIRPIKPNYFPINEQSQMAVGKLLLGAHYMVNSDSEHRKKQAIEMIISGAVDAMRIREILEFNLSMLLAQIVMQQYIAYTQDVIEQEIIGLKTMASLAEQMATQILLPAGVILKDFAVEVTRSMLKYTRDVLASDPTGFIRSARLASAFHRGLANIGMSYMELQTSLGFWQLAEEVYRLQNISGTVLNDTLVRSLDHLLSDNRKEWLLSLAEVMVEIDKRCGADYGPISRPVSVFSGLMIQALVASNDVLQRDREQVQRNRQELLDGLREKILPASIEMTRELLAGLTRDMLQQWAEFTKTNLNQAREIGALVLDFCQKLTIHARNKGDLMISNLYWQTYLGFTSLPGFLFNPTLSLTFSGSLGTAPFLQDLINLLNRPAQYSPLVLDLNGNGIPTLPLNLRRFDLNADGVAEYCGWLNNEDAFLVLDRNGNGRIDSGAEMFGDSTTLADGRRAEHGFAALAELDSNGDGVVDAKDPLWQKLRLWRDFNSNAISEQVELYYLTEGDFASLELGFQPGSGIDANGNDRRLAGHYRRSDGKRWAMDDIWFATLRDPLLPTWTPPSPSRSQIPVNQGFLDLIGTGRVPSLGQAIQADRSGQLLRLLALWRQASGEDRHRLQRFIVLHWCGASEEVSLPHQNLSDNRILMALDALGVWRSAAEESGHAHLAPRFTAVFEEICSLVGHLLEAEERLSPLWSEAIRRDAATGAAALNDAGFERALQDQLRRCRSDEDLIAAGRILRSLPELGPLLMQALQARATRESGPWKRELWLMVIQRINYVTNSERFRWTNHVGSMEVGDAGQNYLIAGAGDDVTMGLGGNDKIEEWEGNDTIIGGPGDDNISDSLGRNLILFHAGDGHDFVSLYSWTRGVGSAEFFNTILFDQSFSPQRLQVRVVQAGLLFSFAGSSDKITAGLPLNESQYRSNDRGVLQLQFMDGTIIDHKEMLRRAFNGGEQNDVLRGLNSNDSIAGGAGDDELLGEEGDDLLQGGSGNDTLRAGIGRDTLQGGSGNDQLHPSYRGNTVILFGPGDGCDQVFTPWIATHIQIQLGAGISAASIVVRRQQERLVIRPSANGESIALMQFFMIHHGRARPLESYSLHFADGTVWDHDRLVDSFLLGGGGADHLIGSDAADTMRGEAGNDSLEGAGGDDLLLGGEGDDLLIGGEGSDRLDGGSGNDSLEGAGGDDLLLGGEGDDLLIGGEGSDRLDGGSGNDSLEGAGGDDLMLGGEGDDLLIGGEGSDRLDGGSGNDTLIALGDDNLQAGSGINRIEFRRGQPILLAQVPAAGSAQNTVVLSAEMGTTNVQLSRQANMLLISGPNGVLRVQDFFRNGLLNTLGSPLQFLRFHNGQQWDSRLIAANVNNSIVGSAANNILKGSAADEWLDGLGGNDFLHGGAGNDVLNGGPGVDTASWAGQSSAVRLDLSLDRAQPTGTGDDTLVSIENLIGGSGPDRLLGDDQANYLDGGLGNDWLDGGGGGDSLVGGDGSDTVSYARSASGVRVNLGLTKAQNSLGAGVDQITGIENLHGSAFADLLYGSDADNRLEGGAGNDTLQGNLGADCLVGGAGADVFVYTNVMETGTKANQRDLLMDFSPIDCIDLSAIDANTSLKGNQEFVWIGAAVFSALGQLRYTQLSQGFGLLEGNISGSLAADFQLEIQAAPALTAASLRL
jgi:Ca2+-binding RTX toxin-like protein